jgi:hypothetical protein
MPGIEGDAPMTICKGRHGKPGCGNPIVWGIDEKGTRHPLDPRAPVYHVLQFDPDTKTYAVERAGGERGVYYVSHFSTCPKANEFSSHKPKQTDPRSRAAGDQ